jgi:putative transcriptional regulator
MNNRIRVLRAEREMSQADLAETVGVSRQAINAVEKGKHVPSLTLAFAIAAVFACRVDEVFEPPYDLSAMVSN